MYGIFSIFCIGTVLLILKNQVKDKKKKNVTQEYIELGIAVLLF